MGMNLPDFCSMTPEEFRQAHGAWLEAEESRVRHGWEMARTLSAFILQPWSKKRLEAVGRAEVPLGRGSED